MLFMGWIESQNKKEEGALQVSVGVVGEAQLPASRGTEGARGRHDVPLIACRRASRPRRGCGALHSAGIAQAIPRGDSVKVELLYKDADHKSSAAGREAASGPGRRAARADRALGEKPGAPVKQAPRSP